MLVVTLAFSRFLSEKMIPSRQAGDILSGMWLLISGLGRVPKTLVWDRESAIGGTGKLTVPAAAFAGTLATRIRLAPPRDPEFKGMVERNNDLFETSFLPGRGFASLADFNDQLTDWLATRANTRTVRAIRGRPVDLLETDRQAMTVLPPVAPQVGLTHRIRLARDYYVRIDANDYSVDPRVIGRFVEVIASPTLVEAFCDGQLVAGHVRSWARHGVVTELDPETFDRAPGRWPTSATSYRRDARSGRTHRAAHPNPATVSPRPPQIHARFVAPPGSKRPGTARMRAAPASAVPVRKTTNSRYEGSPMASPFRSSSRSLGSRPRRPRTHHHTPRKACLSSVLAITMVARGSTGRCDLRPLSPLT